MGRRTSHRRTAARLGELFGGEPLLARELAATDVSLDRVHTAAAAGALVRLRRGAYALDDVRPDGFFEAERHDFLMATVAVMKERPGAVASHASAAVLHGLPCPRADGRWSRCLPALTRSSPDPRTRSGVRLFHRSMPDGDLTETPWGRVTGPARTAVDIASTCQLPEALILVDEVMRGLGPLATTRQRYGSEELAAMRANLLAALLPLAGTRGAVRASRAVAAGSPYAESPAESYSRGVILAAGLVAPHVGLPVRGDDGRGYFGDLVWPHQKVIGEVDGVGKYLDGTDLLAEKRREDALRAAGWAVVRWSGRDIRVNPEPVVRHLCRAFAASNTAG